jgi:predicted TIM-barrel fold metal-dependent hydrolase
MLNDLVIDAQVHVWDGRSVHDLGSATYAPHVAQPFTLDELLPAMTAAGVDRAMLVPPSWSGYSNTYALDCVSAHPHRFRVVGRLDPTSKEAQSRLREWRNQPGMVGLRLVLTHSPGTGWWRTGRLEWLWPMAEKFDIPIALRIVSGLDEIRKIASRYPALQLVVDHMGLPSKPSTHSFDNIEALLRLSDMPNVYVKLSGLPLHSSMPFPFHDLDPYVAAAISAFGPQRLMWGSDLTRLLPAGHTYPQVVKHFREGSLLDDASKVNILGGTASAVFHD